MLADFERHVQRGIPLSGAGFPDIPSMRYFKKVSAFSFHHRFWERRRPAGGTCLPWLIATAEVNE